MHALLAAIFGGIFVNTMLTLILSSNEKLIVGGRLSKYIKGPIIEEVSDQVLKEKRKNAKGKKKHELRLASKEFSNYIH